MALQIRRLNLHQTIDSFDCGDEDLNDFLLTEAQAYQHALLAVTYIVKEEDDSRLLGYYSLANDRVSLSDFENKTEFNRFRKHRFVNEKRLKSYPAVKLCRLAISSDCKGQHIGGRLIDYLKYSFFNNNKTGCRFITVDAYSEAFGFYIKNGFDFLNNDDVEKSTRVMYYDLNRLITETSD
ncbi:MAG: GNAT family N-acetyltransferase [Bacteroidales bacterium]|nr:GNAT family N-acetyltransferase [Bacteroidales bacterium]